MRRVPHRSEVAASATAQAEVEGRVAAAEGRAAAAEAEASTLCQELERSNKQCLDLQTQVGLATYCYPKMAHPRIVAREQGLGERSLLGFMMR